MMHSLIMHRQWRAALAAKRAGASDEEIAEQFDVSVERARLMVEAGKRREQEDGLIPPGEA